MFVNLSNHPSSTWDEAQRKAAEEFGWILDIPFPSISPEWDACDVEELVQMYVTKIDDLLDGNESEVVIQVVGEPVFTFQLVTVLLKKGYRVVASTTERQTEFVGKEKRSVFKFVKFRYYTT
jgi:hypothetical protein